MLRLAAVIVSVPVQKLDCWTRSGSRIALSVEQEIESNEKMAATEAIRPPPPIPDH